MPRRRDPVLARHLDVEQDGRGTLAARLIEHERPVNRHDDIEAGALQAPREQIALVLVIVGEQDERTLGGVALDQRPGVAPPSHAVVVERHPQRGQAGKRRARIERRRFADPRELFELRCLLGHGRELDGTGAPDEPMRRLLELGEAAPVLVRG